MNTAGHRSAAIVVCLAAALAAACSRTPRLAADLIVTRAQVWTGDPQRPAAAAVAVIGDRIVDVGDVNDIDRWRGPATTVFVRASVSRA